MMANLDIEISAYNHEPATCSANQYTTSTIHVTLMKTYA